MISIQFILAVASASMCLISMGLILSARSDLRKHDEAQTKLNTR